MSITLPDVDHKFVETNGIRMHCVTTGIGPPVLLLHGFPEFWYSFRYQIGPLAAAGFHVIVPDIRGYGESDKPESADKYTFLDVLGDVVGLLEALHISEKVFLVGHDFGSGFAWHFGLVRPDLVRGIVSLGYILSEWNSKTLKETPLRPPEFYKTFYPMVFQEPGRAEAMFAEHKTCDVIKSFLTRWHEDPQCGVPKVYADDQEALIPLPHWLTPKDLQYYAETYDRTGFTGAFNHYRNLARTRELTAAWRSKIVEAPALLLIANDDIPFRDPSLTREEYRDVTIPFVPNLRDVIMIDAHHFMHQEQHEEVNKLVIEFLLTFSPSKSEPPSALVERRASRS